MPGQPGADPRRDGPEWTEVEADAALDIGHDLGRAILNARTFEREHKLLQELQELDSYKSQLITTVSHEFKNPLTSIVGHLELLESVELDPMEGRSLEAIARNTGRLQRLVADMLLLSKVGDPNCPLEAQPIDLRDDRRRRHRDRRRPGRAQGDQDPRRGPQRAGLRAR